MYNCIIVLRSSTDAQRLLRAMERSGCTGAIVRPPPALTGGSCAYALKLNESCVPVARNLSIDCAIHIRGVYRINAKGYDPI